jgi:hypothetical protein
MGRATGETAGDDPSTRLRQAHDALLAAADARYRELDAAIGAIDPATPATLVSAAEARRLHAELRATTELIDLLESAVANLVDRGTGGGRDRS